MNTDTFYVTTKVEFPNVFSARPPHQFDARQSPTFSVNINTNEMECDPERRAEIIASPLYRRYLPKLIVNANRAPLISSFNNVEYDMFARAVAIGNARNMQMDKLLLDMDLNIGLQWFEFSTPLLTGWRLSLREVVLDPLELMYRVKA